MQLTKIIDPRDNLGRATRDELWDFAKANGVSFDQRTATKQYMEVELRTRGLTNIRPAVRFMGAPTGEYFGHDGTSLEPPKIREVDADADMLRQMKEQAAKPQDWPVESMFRIHPSAMNMPMLRAECKRLGIKMARTDNINSLREKLSEPHAS